EEFDLDAGVRMHDAIGDLQLHEVGHGMLGLAEDPQHLQWLGGVDFSRMLDGAAERKRAALASEDGELVELGAIPDHLPPGKALASVEVVPVSRWQRDFDVAAIAQDRR